MARIIDGPNGERMIVSEDVEDLNYDSEAINLHLATQVLNQKKDGSTDPFNMILKFKEVAIPVQMMGYTEQPNRSDLLTIKGLMLTTDFIWLIESGETVIKSLGIRLGPQPEIQIKKDSCFSIEKIKIKDMNTLSVAVNLSLKQTT